MKKVRAIGLVGLAPAMVGVAGPAANAAALATHSSPGGSAKTVSLLRGAPAPASPLVNCGYGREQYATSTHTHFTAHISYSHRCIFEVQGILSKVQTGLTERIRYYSYNGTRVLQKYIGGNIVNGITSWTSFPEVYAYQVCEALVANGNHNDVKYGPVCEKATS
jgi:hypothetical protein